MKETSSFEYVYYSRIIGGSKDDRSNKRVFGIKYVYDSSNLLYVLR